MVIRVALVLSFLVSMVNAQGPKAIIDNDRVTVFDATHFPAGPAKLDTVRVEIALRKATYFLKGQAIPASGNSREVRIELKDGRPVPPLKNTSGLPAAFPREGAKRILENSRVVTWDYEWGQQPTVMHFHDKDVVVVYLDNGTLRSTTVDGAVTDNPYTADTVRFNLANRAHAELLVAGKQHAIMTELK